MRDSSEIKYDGRLPDHMKVDIWEAYAREVLNYIDPSLYKDLVIVDKPDLQNADLSIGVEVTQSLSKNEQEAESLYSKLANTTDPHKRKKIIDRISKTGAIYKNGVLYGPNENNSWELNRVAYISKLILLNSGNYSIFDRQYLFIRSTAYPFKNEVEDFLKYMIMKQQGYPFKYHGVVLSVPNFNIQFDLVSNKYTILDFPYTDQLLIGEKARALVIGAENSDSSK